MKLKNFIKMYEKEYEESETLYFVCLNDWGNSKNCTFCDRNLTYADLKNKYGEKTVKNFTVLTGDEEIEVNVYMGFVLTD